MSRSTPLGRFSPQVLGGFETASGQRVTITLSITPEGIYPNAQLNSENFVCGMAQPSVALALASIDESIRDYVNMAYIHLQAGGLINGTPATASPFGDPVDLHGDPNADPTQVWILGRGWVDRSSVNCDRCGDEGRIPTGWNDEGDAENSPCVVVTDWQYCSCAAGDMERANDLLADEAYWEASDSARA